MLYRYKILFFTIFLFVLPNRIQADNKTKIEKSISIEQVDRLIRELEVERNDVQQNYLSIYEKALSDKSLDSIEIFKQLALLNAKLNNPEEAYVFTEKYISNSIDFSILKSDSFDVIGDSAEYVSLKEKYLPKFSFLTFIYFYVSLIGFFITIVINFARRFDKITKLLISGFVAVHALFLLEFVLYMSNMQYNFPHTFYIASSVALLYGPLLYFFFKRTTQNYKFSRIDLLHFAPTILLLIFLYPIYSLPSFEKVKLMLDSSQIFKSHGIVVFILKSISLITYGFLIARIYYRDHKIEISGEFDNIVYWKKNIFSIHIIYVFSYLVYGISISEIMGEFPSFIYHSQVVAMSIMVVYIAYMAYVQPEIFYIKNSSKEIIFKKLKYKNSGLTKALSKELKADLIKLLVEDKIYKENNINLESLSDKLNTTRHNTSQIINEHFGMNFFELINKFRIDEFIRILKEDKYNCQHIIDIAYVVGYNNKVTFNKAFKKETSLTPSQFIASHLKNDFQVKWR